MTKCKYTQASDITITCTSYVPDPPIRLEDGVRSASFNLLAQETLSFELMIKPGSRIQCETTEASNDGDAGLYLRMDNPPDLTNGIYDCASMMPTSQEACRIRDHSGAAVLVATVYAFDDVS